MMNFKSMVAQDIHQVFFNETEFADLHDINGRLLPCIIDHDVTLGAEASLEGVFLNAISIYLKAGSLDDRPKENEPIYVDDRLYFVRSVSDEMGCWVIVAEANAQ